jgi:hypothetical protein
MQVDVQFFAKLLYVSWKMTTCDFPPRAIKRCQGLGVIHKALDPSKSALASSFTNVPQHTDERLEFLGVCWLVAVDACTIFDASLHCQQHPPTCR